MAKLLTTSEIALPNNKFNTLVKMLFKFPFKLPVKLPRARISLKFLIISLFFILLFSMKSVAQQLLNNFDNIKPKDTALSGGFQCYWQENISGNKDWVPLSIISGNKISKKDCMSLDSCYDGLGSGGGGCYKWSKSASAEHIGWDKQDQKKTSSGLLDP